MAVKIVSRTRLRLLFLMPILLGCLFYRVIDLGEKEDVMFAHSIAGGASKSVRENLVVSLNSISNVPGGVGNPRSENIKLHSLNSSVENKNDTEKFTQVILDLLRLEEAESGHAGLIVDAFLKDQSISRTQKMSVMRTVLYEADSHSEALAAVINSVSPYRPYELTEELLALIGSESMSVRNAAISVLSQAFRRFAIDGLPDAPSTELVEQVYETMATLDFDELQFSNEAAYYHFAPLDDVTFLFDKKLTSETENPSVRSTVDSFSNVLISRSEADQISLLRDMEKRFGFVPLYTQNKIMEELIELRTNHENLLSLEGLQIINNILSY